MIEDQVIKRINFLLEFNHWSVYKLAKESSIPYSNLNNIFNRNTCPTIPTLQKICNGFNISLSEFFEFEKNPLRIDTISSDEQNIINTYRVLAANDKKLLNAYLRGLSKQ
ncbi:Transcriptional regulator, contains XRE-family HTH domain [Lachnospiraceae bacterium RM5]|nr:Transcriptional regulator, contains XRE-family HTH domain [Lachnospiraceae bacterium RM5]